MPELIKRDLLFTIAVLLLMAGVTLIFYKVMAPFFVPIAWSVILVVTIQPLNARLNHRLRKPGLSALIMTVLVFFVILAPLTYLGVALVGEASNLYTRVQQGVSSESFQWIDIRQHPFVHDLAQKLDGVIDISQWDLKNAVAGIFKTISTYVVTNTAKFLTNVGVAIFQFVLILLTIYYLFRDGNRLMEQVRESIPLPAERSREILSHLTNVVRATIYGGLVVAAVQGALGGLMFWILGIPSPVFWGTIMGFLSLFPFLGAFVVYIPAAVLLAFSGSYVKAIILISFGIIVVSQIDNFLRPWLISGRTHLHPLLMLFSILGGIQVFGFLGLVLGPVVAAVFTGVFDLYRQSLHEPATLQMDTGGDAADSA